MEWANALLDALLRCDVSSGPRLAVILLGAIASAVTITIGGRSIYSWFFPRHRKAADALRDEGEFRARLNHRDRALELYDLAIKLNPRAAHVYYLRGCVYEDLGESARARADWTRCLERLPSHRDARAKLGQHGESIDWRWAYVTVAVALLVVLTALGAAMATGG